MKRTRTLFTLLITLIFMNAPGQNYYQQQWQVIRSNAKNGVYKSNLPLLVNLESRAAKENNILELIRALRGEFSIINMTQDDPANDTAAAFFTKIQSYGKELHGGQLALFQTFEGQFIYEFYNQNSWKIRNRTNLNNSDTSQLESWSAGSFKDYLLNYYTNLAGRADVLKAIKMADLKPLFEEDSDAEFFPTLNDWVKFQQTEFLNDAGLFTPNERQANRAKILSLFDELVAANSGNSKLYFQHKKLDFETRNTDYKDKLARLEQLLNSSTAGDYKLAITADMMGLLSENKRPKEALALAERAKREYPGSKFLANIQSVVNLITQPSLTVHYEQFTQSEKPIHIVAEGKNVTEFSLKIYKAQDSWREFLSYANRQYDDNAFEKIGKALVRTEAYKLPQPGDYQMHRTSLAVGALPSGIYLAEYIVGGAVAGRFYFIAGTSRVVHHQMDRYNPSKNRYQLINRENGQILADQPLKVAEYVKGKALTFYSAISDSRGIFALPVSAGEVYSRTYLIHQPNTGDYNLLTVNGTYGPPAEAPVFNEQSQIFLDRAVYRPGQTLYFKVILTKKTNGREVVSAGVSRTVTLVDANGQELARQTFTTNEYGSFHGSFNLPSGKLNGIFSLQTGSGEQENVKIFRVEEYKRPQFEVTIDPVKGDYSYGETVPVTGRAALFSGVPLANATVNYEIKKINLRWMYFPWYPAAATTENSVLGQVTADASGQFTINVGLEKDPATSGIQVNNYEISATVTDINGETHTAVRTLKVASVTHYLQAKEVPDQFTDQDVTVQVEAKNYSDQPVTKAFTVKLKKLKEDRSVYRQNFKEVVQDMPAISQAEFETLFPHDYYSADELKPNTDGDVLSRRETASDGTAAINLGKLAAGKYQLEIFNTEGSDTIRAVRNFEVFNKGKLLPAQKPMLKVLQPQREYTPGQRAVIYAYSAVPGAQVNVFVQNGDGSTIADRKVLTNGVLAYEVQMPSGGSTDQLSVQFQLTAYNDVRTETVLLNIAPVTDSLRIETVTFRDKLQPGQQERWAVKVSGTGHERVNAEVLANMYDISLDQLMVNTYSWDKTGSTPRWFADYAVSSGLDAVYYSKRVPFFSGRNIQVPVFSWYTGFYPAPRIEKQLARASSARMTTFAKDAVQETVVAGAAAPPAKEVVLRSNLQETAFFYPQLYTGKDGDVKFEFTAPEALTRWKFMVLAHTRDARAAILQKEIVTQKELSVTPNYPRFLREGDDVRFQSRISNLSAKTLSGTASIKILDALTMTDISEKFMVKTSQDFTVPAAGSSAVNWQLKVPQGAPPVVIQVTAGAGRFSDGEQQAVPVLTNRILVHETIPVFVKEGQTKSFTLKNLSANNASTIKNISNTLVVNTNPMWEVLMALPSLKQDANSSADVVFNRWFAGVLASEILKTTPKLKAVFEEYQRKNLAVSKLSMNEQLKDVLLEETPWLVDEKSETEQIQQIARLFDANTMRNAVQEDWSELKNRQNPDGGFSWFPGGPSSYHTSLYILKHWGKLQSWLKDSLASYQDAEQKPLAERLVRYADAEVSRLVTLENEPVYNDQLLNYLDSRYRWEPLYPLKGQAAKLKTAFIAGAKAVKPQDFTFFGLHRAALIYDAYGLKNISQTLMRYLKETSTVSETQGAYWKANTNGWNWYASRVANHAGALEAFAALTGDRDFTDELKIWLLTQKQVNHWDNSRATAEVIFTMLNAGESWTGAESGTAEMVWGNIKVTPDEAVTGYVRQTIPSETVNPALATVTITKKGPGIAQGGLFWTYTENINSVKSAESYLSLRRELYKKIKTENGEQLLAITPTNPLRIGDRVTVRMILNTDRSMQYVHLKDLRAAGLEPVEALSGYRWKNGLGYYQSVKDTSVNFFIEYLPKGQYVFEYDLISNAAGDYSGGITTLQNYYAPEMSSHTAGTRVIINP